MIAYYLIGRTNEPIYKMEDVEPDNGSNLFFSSPGGHIVARGERQVRFATVETATTSPPGGVFTLQGCGNTGELVSASTGRIGWPD